MAGTLLTTNKSYFRYFVERVIYVYIYAVSLFAQLVYRLVNGPLALRMPRRALVLLLPCYLGLLRTCRGFRVRPRVRRPDFTNTLTFFDATR